MDWRNKLYFGDNLDILRREVPDASVDLIYLDPPFNSNATYNVLLKEKSGEGSAARDHRVRECSPVGRGIGPRLCEKVEAGLDQISKVMQAFRTPLGNNDLPACSWWSRRTAR
jgi:site-specific DNA-methyltransferase (adenine-specific)